MGIAELATILTAVGVAIYVLGLIGLALTLRLAYTDRLARAWYAVSLMPRAIVAGQGMRIWRGGWFNASLVLVPPVLTTVLLLGFRTIPLSSPYDFLLVGFVVFVSVVLVARRTDLATRSKSAQPPPQFAAVRKTPQHPPLGRRTAILLLGPGALIACLGSYIASRAVQLDTSTVNWESVTLGVLVFVIGAFFVGVPLAGAVEPPLPWVVLLPVVEPNESGKVEAEKIPRVGPDEADDAESNEARESTMGWLIAHTDGYWHLFDSQHVLVSIPDSKVAEAHVYDYFEEPRSAGRA
jgi:hypothetical protein